MNRTLRILTIGAALLGPALSGAALAQTSYPRSVGAGENSEIDYGPGPHGNIVGGGRALATNSGENTRIEHLDPHYAQAPRPGGRAVIVGSGENASVVWVPADISRTRLALIGGDGTLPAENGADRGGALARLLNNFLSRG
jgi:hypothetical protein